MANTWTYTMKNITKYPNVHKNFGTKYILMANGSFPTNTRAEAIRYIKNTPEYRRRVNKPTIKIIISN